MSASARKLAWTARADCLEAWAAAAEAKADALVANHNHDWAFVSQPGHLPARARQIAQTDRAMELRRKAAGHREKAATLRQMAARNKGDAEAARTVHRAALSGVIEPMMYVESIYGVRRVLKVNAKSLRIEGALGPITIDKALCKVVPERCGTCGSWRAEPGATEGECWSGDRLDGDMTKGPASYPGAANVCEAWWPRAIAKAEA
jgi:hypothetical protein